MKTKQLKDILTTEQIKQVYKFLRKQDFQNLREYLRTQEQELKEKGVYCDYLYYWLEGSFKK